MPVIEERYPSPSVHLDSPKLARLEALMPAAVTPLRPLFLALVPRTILSEASFEYWYRTRGEAVGMHIDEYVKRYSPEECYAAAQPALAQITALLQETEGPYFLGETVSYADFVWGAYLAFCKTLGDNYFHQVVKTAGGEEAHLALFRGIEKWTERNNY